MCHVEMKVMEIELFVVAGDFHFRLLQLLLEFVRASVSIYVHYNLKIDVKERDALICVTTFLQILILITLFTRLNYYFLPELMAIINRQRGNNTETQRGHLVVFMFGTVGVVFVNAVVLSVELILTARNGERTVDLRLILLPTESVFAACYLALQISTFWKDNRERFRDEIKKLRQKCVCKQRQRDSPPQSNEHELENLASVPQPSVLADSHPIAPEPQTDQSSAFIHSHTSLMMK
ncbi:uncharacterized protein LOC113650977 [Tachysurus fulvidraco]|uniref:uncharacterized protein LOC113650977 n=1 Tax=Tachysurus fulvidraco TaxID=1234273 RepID=UPI001FF023D0|nr:uncharacterized protein LOC113650977 [Tachysurus fulvidraco]